MSLIGVKFLVPFAPWNPGERAGVPGDVAKKLVDRGMALYVQKAAEQEQDKEEVVSEQAEVEQAVEQAEVVEAAGESAEDNKPAARRFRKPGKFKRI